MNDKTIIRVERNKNNPYMMLERKLAGNKAISYEALGLLTYLFSKPDDWKVIISDLMREGCTRNKVYALLKTLIALGYVERIDHRDGKQRFTFFEYVVREEPLPQKPDLAQPDLAQPDLENRDALLSTESLLSNELLLSSEKYVATAIAPAPRELTAHQRMFQSVCDVMGVSVADVTTSGQNGDYGRVASILIKAAFPAEDLAGLRAFTLKLGRDNHWTQPPGVNALSKYFPNYRASKTANAVPTPQPTELPSWFYETGGAR